MDWSGIPLKPSTKTLREFAVLWVLFFGGIALWRGFVRHEETTSLVFGVLAVTVGPVGVIWPGVMRPIFVTWMVAVFPIGWVVSRLLIGILFFGVITPVGLLFRIKRRDVLGLRRRQGTSYWQPKPPPGDVSSYFRQF